MSFDKLLGDLDALQKLQKSETAADAAADDESIAAAAAEGQTGVPAGEGDPDPDDAVAPADANGESDPADDDADALRERSGDEETFGKSFRVQLGSGEEVDAFDGTKLVKSLMARVETQEAASVAQAETLTKALGVAVDLLTEHGKTISLLKSEVVRLGSEGRGRKAVVSVNEKPSAVEMNKSAPVEGLSSEEFMGKALAAQAAGRITGLQVSIAEGSLLKGLAVPAEIINKVLA